MGTFSAIRNVAKCAARMGQCFSSRFTSLPLPRALVCSLPDVTRHSYCFTDGVGAVSPEAGRALADAIAPYLDRPVAGGGGVGTRREGGAWLRAPSAFQMRYAGAKGVVAVWPRRVMQRVEREAQVHGEGGSATAAAGVEVAGGAQQQQQAVGLMFQEGQCAGAWCEQAGRGAARGDGGVVGQGVAHMWVRPSMDKFESQHADVEVINWTRPQPCFLNRQIVTLLSTLGVPDQVFLDMQDTMVQRLDAAVSSRASALRLLEESGADHLYGAAMAMLRAGFHPAHEPHLKRMIRAYGQCFIQVCDATAPTPTSTYRLNSTGRGMGAPRVVSGPVVFGKNPCLHPGDLRLLTAVDAPCLHHLIDCLVLPKHGPRPHANEASGSDMDGDVYFVAWDQRLLPPGGRSSEPMDYQPAKKDGRAAVTMTEVHLFFVDHMLNDSVGIICNAHVVHADRSPMGAFDPACITLAREAA
ncbi:hypothetical protein CLOM_g2823 [Closterium sp. NIES-68]|nr:hypothetical protein CLOM_g2823 [Closterium sp. NIES-68]GJP71122.1 hypothetical protein CLOP_g1971 [Closterium sp. NIES-67]